MAPHHRGQDSEDSLARQDARVEVSLLSSALVAFAT